MEEKTCSKCKTVKNREEFRSRTGPKANKDGLSPVCRICERDAKRVYDAKKRQENPLRTCGICGATKHHTLFQPYYKNEQKCLDCVNIKKQRKIEDKEKRIFEHLVQHQDGTKRCSKCRLFKPHEQFWKSKHTNDGFYSSCIDCTNLSNEKFSDRRKANQKDWKSKNIEKLKAYANEWDRNKRATDPAYKLRRNVMHAIIASIRNYGFKNKQTEKLNKAIFNHLPYTSEQLKAHIESLWEPWMTWNNYGKYDPNQKTWQIDHILPQSSLPFSDLAENNFQELWNLSNLRPLETIANIKKGKKISA